VVDFFFGTEVEKGSLVKKKIVHLKSNFCKPSKTKLYMKKKIIYLLVLVFVLSSADVMGQKVKKKKSKKETATEATTAGTASGSQNEPFKESIKVYGEVAEVEAKGVGVNREDALQNALRLCVEQAAGVTLSSETRVENFVVIKDAITSKADGYITSYSIIKEVPFPDRYEVTVRAKVSLSPMKADFGILSKAVGGIRFLVMYDERSVASGDLSNYEFATERVNEFLSQRGYRYIDKKRFDALKTESRGIMNDIRASEETYIQHIGLKSDAQFIIFIKNIRITSRSEAFDTRTNSKIVIECKAYDNCTAEGLGTIILESDWKSGREVGSQILAGISEAIERDFEKLLGTFTRYIGSWANNGTPFELRFYHTGTYRELRALRTRLQGDSDFGGDMEIVSFDNFTKLNCTFKNRPDQLADKILDIADAIPELAAKKLDVKFIYGRQINFAPSSFSVEELNILTPAPSTEGDNNKTR